MVESHAFIFADTISLDSQAPLTLGWCLREVVSSRCKRIPVIRSTAYNQATYWLDLGEGIDLCRRAIGARGTGWIGAMRLIHGGVPNDKVLYGCWI